jgi:RNA polymerase sigma-70 factor (ECF subfamily)
MLPLTNPSLVLRLKNRQDWRAWDQFDKLYRPMLRRVALRRGLQDSDAEEVVQDVMMTVLQSIQEYQSNGNVGAFRCWLQTIANRKAINRMLRDQKHRGSGRTEVHEQLGAAPDRAENALAQELTLEFRRQLFHVASQSVQRRCDPLTWAAFWKTAIELRDPEEVARELGMKLGSVYVARSRIQSRIRDLVQSQSSLWESGHWELEELP